jgi:hypothetical protein
MTCPPSERPELFATNGALTVFVEGQIPVRHPLRAMRIVCDRTALAFDYADASARLQMAQRRAIEKVPAFDWAGRGAAEIMPPTFRSK